jgi:pyruvate-formate lyase-activating enzyme/glutaredoxin
MGNTIYTATGCARCKITKRYMGENGIEYEEFDVKGEGEEAFGQFYRANRKKIFRGKDGVEFPVFTDGNEIRQGVSVIIGYLMADSRLDGFIGQSALHGEWIDGFDLSGGDPDQADGLIAVLSYLKKNGLKLQLTANGRNSAVLERVLEKKLGDRMIMEVKGPASLYGRLLGEEIDPEEIFRSIALTAGFPEYTFYTTVAPVVREDGALSYLTPEEIGETAKMIEEATGSKKHPYVLRRYDPNSVLDDAPIKYVEPLPDSAMFKYRTAARRHQVMTEIEK